MHITLSSSLRLVTANDKVVIMDVSSGKFFSCNPVGAEVINASKQGSSVEQIVITLASKYQRPEKSIKADIEAFIKSLQEMKLCHVA